MRPEISSRYDHDPDHYTFRRSLREWEHRHPPYWRQVPRGVWITLILTAGIALGIVASFIGSLL